MTCSHQPGSGVSLSFTLLLVTSIGALGFLVGARQSNQPEWDCYRSIWNDEDQMALHGLNGASAVEVHEYCAEAMRLHACECECVDTDIEGCLENGYPTLPSVQDEDEPSQEGGSDEPTAGAGC